MSTKQSQAKKVVAPNNSGEEDDLGALIYRESQLRKVEAAAAAESKKASTASSTHHRTSTRKISHVKPDEKPSTGQPSKVDPKRKKGVIYGGRSVQEKGAQEEVQIDTKLY